MTEDYIEDFECDCSKRDSTWNHDVECALWECDAFEKGAALWDSSIDALVMLTDEEQEHLGIDEYNDSFSLMNATADEIGGTLSDQFVAPVDEPDPVWIGDIMVDDPVAQQLCNDSINKWVDDATDFPGNFSYRGVTWVWDVTQASWVSKELGCYCENDTLNPDQLICHNCQVTRKAIDTDRWYQVRYRPGELVCKCITKALWTCVTCEVTREFEYLPFEEDKRPAVKQLSFTPSEGGAITYSGSSSYGSYGNSNTYQKCRHYAQDVTFPDGTKVWASSHHQRKEGEALPDFGFYLDSIWKPQCLAFYINWTDYGLPVLAWDRVVEGIKTLHKLASTQQVEIGCIGGHGRTGTVLACLAILSGVEGDKAVDWVHKNYCEHAVEGGKQEWWVSWFDATVNGKPIPEMPSFSTFGKKMEDSHKYGDRLACCFKEQNGNRYCGRCQTDLLASDQAPKPIPDKCWWCDAQFASSKKEVDDHDKDWKAAQKDPKAPHLQPMKSGGSNSTGGGKGKGVAAGAAAKSADEMLAEAKERLWPTKRYKVSQEAGEGLRCTHCWDQVSWRWPSYGYQTGNWVHRTSPGLSIDKCENVRTKDQFRRSGANK